MSYGKPRIITEAATLNVEYPCDRSCQVEVTLEGKHIRGTLGQLLQHAENAHLRAHEVDPARTFNVGPDALVRQVIPSA